MYLNVFFTPMERSLNDAHLLSSILDKLEKKHDPSMSMTLWPEQDNPDVCCVSINVPGNEPRKMYLDALAQVRVWIRDYPSKGLPFQRSNIFK